MWVDLQASKVPGKISGSGRAGQIPPSDKQFTETLGFALQALPKRSAIDFWRCQPPLTRFLSNTPIRWKVCMRGLVIDFSRNKQQADDNGRLDQEKLAMLMLI